MFLSFNPPTVALLFVCWELLFQGAKPVIQNLLPLCCLAETLQDARAKAKLVREGPSYVVSTVHALAVTAIGARAYLALAHAPPAAAMLIARGAAAAALAPAHAAAQQLVLFGNSLFFAYILNDGMHVLSMYPTLGGPDVLVHHALFLYCR